MTAYMRNTLTKQYAKELVAIGELLRQQKELNVELTAGERWTAGRACA